MKNEYLPNSSPQWEHFFLPLTLNTLSLMDDAVACGCCVVEYCELLWFTCEYKLLLSVTIEFKGFIGWPRPPGGGICFDVVRHSVERASNLQIKFG